MKILVTGGSGFIGSRLVAELVKLGHDVRIYDKNPSEAFPRLLIEADIRDTDRLARAMEGVEAVFHLAAEHRDDVRPLSLYDEINVEGTRNVVKAAERAGCRRIVFTSSVAIYPLNSGPVSESHPPQPFNKYGESKYGAEKVLNEWAGRNPGASLVIVRPSVVFGEKNRGNVYNLLSQIHRGRFVMVGNGKNRKSMSYVGNIVPFLAFGLTLGAGVHVYNYADKPDLTAAEIVSIANREFNRNGIRSRIRLPYGLGMALGYACDVVARVTGRQLPLSSIRVKKFCSETLVSADRVEKTGFKRPISLETAVKAMIDAEFKQ